MRGGTYFEDGQPVAAVEADVFFDEVGTSADPMEVAREVLKLIVGAKNPGFQAEVLALLLGVGFAGCSEQEIATRNGCTRAAVSARMVKVREQVQLNRAVGPMRQDSTRRECRRSRVLASMN